MIFISNKYTKWYYQIINNAKYRKTIGYTESHHIIPKSLGGVDDDSNLITLTAREHYICHLLLPKMLTGTNKSKMFYALWSMSIILMTKDHTRDYKVKSTLYEYARKEHIQNLTGQKRSPETKLKMSLAASRLRGPMSEKHKLSIAKGQTGRKHSPETKLKMSLAKLNKSKLNNIV